MKPREIFVIDNIAIVPLTQGAVAIVDTESVPLIEKFNWHLEHNYAVRTMANVHVYMHQVISRSHSEIEADHKNGNGLDNRKLNLRLATRQQNSFSRKLNKNNSTGYKGVVWDANRGLFRAQICVNKVKLTIGRFTTVQDAAKAYAEAAKKYFGEFART